MAKVGQDCCREIKNTGQEIINIVFIKRTFSIQVIPDVVVI